METFRRAHQMIRGRFTIFLAWRNLNQARTRTILSVMAVAIGVSMTIAADIIGGAILNAFTEAGDALKFLHGLLDRFDIGLQMMGIGIAFASGFVVYNAFAIAVTQRRGQIGVMRSIGMSRSQVMSLVLVEALFVGLLGTMFGLVIGPLLGKGFIVLMKVLLGDLFVFASGSASAQSILVSIILGMGITVFSTAIPAWRATQISPLAAARQETASSVLRNPIKRGMAGGLGIIILVVYLAAAPPGEWVEMPWDSILTGLGILFWLTCLILLLPAVIGFVGQGAHALLSRIWGAIGRLISDNLQRERGRVTQTVLTLALALTMIISVTGFTRFQVDELLSPKLFSLSQKKIWVILPFDILGGMASYYDLETLQLSPEMLAEMAGEFTHHARIVEANIVVVPELSFIESTYFSYVFGPQELQFIGNFSFTFTQGDWERALPIMESGCGVLITPLVAGKNNVSLGDVFDVTGEEGPVECVVAGIGSPLAGASILSSTAGDSFSIGKPIMAYVIPLPGVDPGDLEADLSAFINQYDNIHLIQTGDLIEKQTEMVNQMPTVFNSLLLLAILAAALGIVNATMMNVAERRQEIGLLRAAGASRRQIQAIVVGEAALMGLIGGAAGLVAGSGVTVIVATVMGGNAWGYPHLDLWGAAWRSVQPAMLSGLYGIIAAPIVSAFAASFPIRSILRNSVIEIMEPARQE